MVAAVAVENVDVVDLVKFVLQRIRCENAGDPWVKSAAEERGDASFFEAFAIRPLPFVFKLGGVFWFVVGSVNVVGLGCQAGIHDGEILIWKSEVDDNIWLELFDQRDDVFGLVSVELRGVEFCFSTGEFCCEFVALALCAARDHDFFNYFTVLAHFVDRYRSDTTTTNY